jgi:4-hydroxybenzoate polyprenyltransferase
VKAWGIFASAYRLHLSPLTIAAELPLYFIGSVVLHSAACIWNDVCDKDFDAKVGQYTLLRAFSFHPPVTLLLLTGISLC